MKTTSSRSILAVVILASGCASLAGIAPSVAGMTAGPSGWKTFVSKEMQVALDYPADWSVRALPTQVVFTSPQGVTVQLGVVETGLLSPEEFQREALPPNTRCTSKVNVHSLVIRTCVDTVSFVYTADFIIRPRRAPPRLFSLAMSRRGDVDVFRAMIESLRPVL